MTQEVSERDTRLKVQVPYIPNLPSTISTGISGIRSKHTATVNRGTPNEGTTREQFDNRNDSDPDSSD